MNTPIAYRRAPDHGAEPPASHPVVIVGAGPVGLTLAIDLAQRGVPVVLLDNDDTLATGSRAICFAKRSLEVFDRLGCGERMVERGVSWNVGRVFFGDDEIYRFDLQAEPGHARPAFINLQQYHVEAFLVERAAELPKIDLRWRHEVTGLEQRADHALLTIATPDGPTRLRAAHVVACDGSRSALRRLAGLETRGQVFRDRFLIADVKMAVDFPAERWFWFDPPFHRGQSVLLHKQPDGLWRIDFQLGWDADPEREKQPEHILPRVRALLAGSAMRDAAFELEWASVYTFACTRMARFRAGRVLFAGDSAHGVSPFGARGANSGIQDADNLGWKLAAVVAGHAGEALLDSYASEREAAADENILNSTRSTDFITPKSEISRLFRDAVLELAREHRFARALVNSGRLSVPATLVDSPLNTADLEAFAGRMVPGAAAVDAPLTRADGSAGWLLPALGRGFTLMVAVATAAEAAAAIAERPGVDQGAEATRELDPAARKCAPLDAPEPDGVRLLPVILRAEDRPDRPMSVTGIVDAALPAPMSATDIADAGVAAPIHDRDGLIAARYDLRPGTAYLFRPDQHVVARWRAATPEQVRRALERALGRDAGTPEPPAAPGKACLERAVAVGDDASAPPAAPDSSASTVFATAGTVSPVFTSAPNIDDPDDVYEALIDAHRGLEAAASQALNARLVLLLANQIGRGDVLRAALAAARSTDVTAATGPSTGSGRTGSETTSKPSPTPDLPVNPSDRTRARALPTSPTSSSSDPSPLPVRAEPVEALSAPPA